MCSSLFKRCLLEPPLMSWYNFADHAGWIILSASMWFYVSCLNHHFHMALIVCTLIFGTFIGLPPDPFAVVPPCGTYYAFGFLLRVCLSWGVIQSWALADRKKPFDARTAVILGLTLSVSLLLWVQPLLFKQALNVGVLFVNDNIGSYIGMSYWSNERGATVAEHHLVVDVCHFLSVEALHSSDSSPVTLSDFGALVFFLSFLPLCFLYRNFKRRIDEKNIELSKSIELYPAIIPCTLAIAALMFLFMRRLSEEQDYLIQRLEGIK